MAVTLTNSYQYIGRSGLTSQNGAGTHYVLLYAKTEANQDTGIHRVYVQTKMASNYGTFYGYDTTSRGYVNDTQAFTVEDKPSSAWSGKNAIAAADAGGTKYSQSFTLGSGYVDVDCSDCQSKTIKVKLYYEFRSTGDTYTPKKGAKLDKVSFDVVLPAILRQVKIASAPNFTDEDNPTVTFVNNIKNNATKIETCIAIKDSSGTWTTTGATAYRELPNKTDTSYTFNLTDAERKNLRTAAKNAVDLPIAFFVQTTIGTTVKREYKEAVMGIKDGEPTGSISIKETNTKVLSALGTDLTNTAVEGVSDLEVTMTAEAKKEASPRSITIVSGAKKIEATTTTNDASVVFTKVLEDITNQDVSYTIKDSRGLSYTNKQTLNLLAYSKVEVSNVEFKRASLDSNEITVSAKIKFFNGNVGNASNSSALRILYSGTNGRDGEITTYTKSGEKKTGEVILTDYSLGEIVDDEEFPTFTLTASDLFSEASGSYKIVSITPTFEAGQSEFRINGDLVIADKKGLNPKNIMEMLYPVGSIYITMNGNFSPGETFGGTWVQFGTGKTLVGVDSADNDFNTVRKTGGHKELQSHNHSITIDSKTLTGSWKQNRSRFGGTNTVAGIVSNIKETISGYFSETGGEDINTVGISINATHNHTGSSGNTGGGNAKNLQPYITVYMWERRE